MEVRATGITGINAVKKSGKETKKSVKLFDGKNFKNNLEMEIEDEKKLEICNLEDITLSEHKMNVFRIN